MTMDQPLPPDPAAFQEPLGQASGRQYWRCLEELVDAEAFQKLLGREFPAHVTQRPDAATRRQFLTLMGASLALAGLSGCDAPQEEIVPYVRQPAELTEGKPLFFATAMVLGGVATGLLVEQHLGRPIKVEGNPDHPASLGATDLFSQAAVLSLYDPDRSRVVLHQGEESSWARAASALGEVTERLRDRQGAGLRLLTESITSPTFAWQLEQLLEEFPQARWHQYEPVIHNNARQGARQAFGQAVDPVYHLERADVILALDADFLDCGPAHLRYVREFADRRRIWPSQPEEAQMNRLYAAGPVPSSTSALADHHLPLRASEVGLLAQAVAQQLGAATATNSSRSNDSDPFPEKWLIELVEDLRRHRGRSLVVAGPYQPPAVHALVYRLNSVLENVGQTVDYIRPIHARPVDEMQSLRELTADMQQGKVEALVILGGNPVFNAPADIDFAQALSNVPFRLHLGMYQDETAKRCSWHIPETHFLETWADARAYDGTVSLIQPLIAPLYGGVSALQLVAALRGDPELSAHKVLSSFWREQWQMRDEPFEVLWQRALHDGMIRDTAFSPLAVEVQPAAETGAGSLSEHEPSSLELVFRPDPTIYDGRFANNAWLQELPKPLLKTTWDNVAVFAPKTAERLGLTSTIGPAGGDIVTDVVELRYQDRRIEAPAWILPGQAEDSVTVYFGYGRDFQGRVGSGQGFDAYRLRSSQRPWFDRGLEVRKTGRRYRLAATQLHHLMHGRDLVRAGTLEQYRQHPHSLARLEQVPVTPTPGGPPLVKGPEAGPRGPHAGSLYPEYSYRRYKWGMVIDQSVCTGCNACVVACQAENNIPVVGKEEVLRGREMHWLRVDSYYHGSDPGRPEATYFQPVPCMHCEKAPCELVCPVNATVHSDEGLNDMNYARCVGTRYCSNNCPYKVRRFNYFQYADWNTESLKPLRNPEVTVRSRGVMEKCTYCVQRINAARLHAELDDRPPVQNREGEWIKPIYENELLTACQAACPTQAIVFGDLNDRQSQVSHMRYDQPLQYGLLDEHLGTQPRTTYLAAVRNPNPRIQTP